MSELPPVNPELVLGADAGGTKVHILGAFDEKATRFETTRHPDMYAVLDIHFRTIGQRPAKMLIAMAGPRDKATGQVDMTNCDWPVFDPRIAEERYKGTSFTTVNDMVGTAAGIIDESSINRIVLKPAHHPDDDTGAYTPDPTETKVAVTISTGVGASAAVWDDLTSRFISVPSEIGHIAQPGHDRFQYEYVQALQTKYGRHVSVEQALSGKYGIPNMIEHLIPKGDIAYTKLRHAIRQAHAEDRPVGAALMAFALEDKTTNGHKAREIIDFYGSMVGAALRSMATSFVAKGGLYLTGSVAVRWGEYLAANTPMNSRFVQAGAVHSNWLDQTPIYLVTDEDVAAKGALRLVRERYVAEQAA